MEITYHNVLENLTFLTLILFIYQNTNLSNKFKQMYPRSHGSLKITTKAQEGPVQELALLNMRALWPQTNTEMQTDTTVPDFKSSAQCHWNYLLYENPEDQVTVTEGMPAVPVPFHKGLLTLPQACPPRCEPHSIPWRRAPVSVHVQVSQAVAASQTMPAIIRSRQYNRSLTHSISWDKE